MPVWVSYNRGFIYWLVVLVSLCFLPKLSCSITYRATIVLHWQSFCKYNTFLWIVLYICFIFHFTLCGLSYIFRHISIISTCYNTDCLYWQCLEIENDNEYILPHCCSNDFYSIWIYCDLSMHVNPVKVNKTNKKLFVIIINNDKLSNVSPWSFSPSQVLTDSLWLWHYFLLKW